MSSSNYIATTPAAGKIKFDFVYCSKIQWTHFSLASTVTNLFPSLSFHTLLLHSLHHHTLPLFFSYQHKVDSDLAEYLVQQFKPEEQKLAPEEQKLAPEEGNPFTDTAAISSATSNKEKRHRMSQSLQKFYAMDLHQMEAESRSVPYTVLIVLKVNLCHFLHSTSGSDSDNDDFTLACNKVCKCI